MGHLVMRTNKENYKYYLKCEEYRYFELQLFISEAGKLQFSEVVREINTRVIKDFFVHPETSKCVTKNHQPAAVKNQGKPAF